MRLKYLGHSGFEISTMGRTLIIDPYISPNPAAISIRVENLKADYVLLTHAHNDHVADAEQIARQNNASVISNFEVVSWFEKREIAGHAMNHGGKWEFDFGTLKYVRAVHSSTMPDNSPGGSAGGFVLWNEEGCLYIAGDTALTLDMQLIPLTCPKLDAAILPVGDNFTMGYEDAVIAAGYLECKRVIGCHFDTFEPIRIDHEAARAAFDRAGRELTLPKIGQEMEV